MSPLAVDRLGAGRDVDTAAPPVGVTTSTHQLTTADGAKVEGVLHALDGATTVVTVMHPRQSLTHHPMIPLFLRAGVSVWTQGTRSPNNDIALVHEQALLDAAAGHVFLRDLGYASVLTFGHSGGGTLSAFYIEQAALEPETRIDVTPAGRPVPLAGTRMPLPDGAIFLAPHPGQGQVLRHCIDPSVTDEADPMSVDPALDSAARPNAMIAAQAAIPAAQVGRGPALGALLRNRFVIPPLSRPASNLRVKPSSQAFFRLCFFSGRSRMRLPVAAKIALSTAGAATAMVGSPTPPQNPPDGMVMVSTLGISSILNTG